MGDQPILMHTAPVNWKRMARTAAILLTLTAVTACSLTDRFRRPSRLEAVPAGEVTSTPLEVTPSARPGEEQTPDDRSEDELVRDNQEAQQQATTPTNAPDVNRADLIGAWSMVSGGSSARR